MIDKVKPLIEMKEIIKAYNIGLESEIEILHGIDLKIYEGEFVAIVGESGSGKSTLMNIIGVLDKQTKGEYYLDGIDIKNANEAEMNVIRNKKIGFVFQNFNLIGRTSALRNVELPMLYAGVPAEQRTKRAKELLSKVGMESRMNHMPNELSGGQKQRVAIARSLVNNPSIILADEPTGALDSETSTMVMNIFNDLNKNQGKTIILITHSKEIAEQCPRIVTIKDGKIINDSKEVVS
ncbi:MAG: ABC transporter ATP-binding protein [Clostridium sp.]|uniref:ABC transporter ATP-binding protein n=1 Tax=Clostridium sp. TaxID=1506 RepID=UPI003990AA35